MDNKYKDALNTTNRLAVELGEVYNWVTDKYQHFFSEFHITPQQYNVLAILYEMRKPVSTSVILEWMIEKNAGVSRLVDRLLKKGLVIKSENKQDKRLVDVALSSTGKQLYERIAANFYQLNDFTKNLTDEEAKMLISLLIKIKEQQK